MKGMSSVSRALKAMGSAAQHMMERALLNDAVSKMAPSKKSRGKGRHYPFARQHGAGTTAQDKRAAAKKARVRKARGRR